METSYKALIAGLIMGTVAAFLYYPAVVAVGLLSYFATTPPPLGPLPSETQGVDTALRVLAYPSRIVAGPGGGSVWSVVNPLAHGVLVGVAGGGLSGVLAWLATKDASAPRVRNQLPGQDSNLEKQDQNLL